MSHSAPHSRRISFASLAALVKLTSSGRRTASVMNQMLQAYCWPNAAAAEFTFGAEAAARSSPKSYRNWPWTGTGYLGTGVGVGVGRGVAVGLGVGVAVGLGEGGARACGVGGQAAPGAAR